MIARIKLLEQKISKLERQNKKQQEALAVRNEAELFRIACARSSMVLWTTDKNLKITYSAGGGARKSRGGDPTLGKTLYQLFGIKDKKHPSIAAHIAALKGKSGSYETEWGGNWFDAFVQPYYDEKKKIKGTLGIASIVTENKRSEAEFHQSRETLALLLSNIDELAYYIEYQEGGKIKVKYIGTQTQRLLGLSPKEFINRSQKELLSRCHPEDVPAMVMVSEKTKKTKKPHTMVYRFRHMKTGKYVWLEETIYPQVKGGKHIGNFGVTRDVTKKIEADRILRESEEKFRQLSRSSPVGIYLSDEHGNITYVNQKFRSITDVPLKKIISNQWFSLIHPEDSKRVITRITRGVKNRTEYFEEFRVVRKNKKISWAKLHATTIKDEKDNVTGWVGIVEDITERKAAEAGIRESEERFRLLSDVALEGIILSQSGRVIDANNRFLQMLGYKNKEEILGKHFIDDLVAKEDIGVAEKSAKMATSGSTEVRAKRKDGNYITVISKGQDIPYKGKTARATVAYDISDRKRNELELEKSKENYRSLIEQSPDGIFIHDEKGNVVFGNPSMLKIMGVETLDQLPSNNIFAYTLPEYHQTIKDRKKSVGRGEDQEFLTIRMRRPDGKVLELDSRPASFVYEGKKATLVVCHDVSYQRQLEREQLRAQMAEESNRILQQEILERRKVELQLLQAQKFTRNLIESSLDMICASDINGNVIEFNEAAQKTFGYKAEEVLGKRVEFLYANPQDRLDVMLQLYSGAGSFAGEVLNRKKSGETFHAFLSASVLKNENGEVIGSMGVSRDISELKKADKQIKQSLREKEVLLKEVHHRVKNNLQVISSILNLQSSFVKDANTLAMLKESQNRIKSMAFIHESLYQNKDFSHIDFSEYVINLAKNLVHSYEIYSDQIDLKLDVGKVFLNLDQAIPCGLIMNEIISNALKYAFPKGRKGVIGIKIRSGEEETSLVLSDDGVGLPPHVNYRDTESLGLQLVMSLVEQLSGKIELDQQHGTKYIITFKNSKN